MLQLKRSFLFWFVALSSMTWNAWAEKTYELTGIIEKLTSDSMVVEKDGERFELALDPKGSEITKKARVGDQVTVWYTFNAKNIVVQKSRPKQLPGTINPQEHIILDDRVFYDAKNNQKKGIKNHTTDQEKG